MMTPETSDIRWASDTADNIRARQVKDVVDRKDQNIEEVATKQVGDGHGHRQ
jgi:hypothetical protein